MFSSGQNKTRHVKPLAQCPAQGNPWVRSSNTLLLPHLLSLPSFLSPFPSPPMGHCPGMKHICAIITSTVMTEIIKRYFSGNQHMAHTYLYTVVLCVCLSVEKSEGKNALAVLLSPMWVVVILFSSFKPLCNVCMNAMDMKQYPNLELNMTCYLPIRRKLGLSE